VKGVQPAKSHIFSVRPGYFSSNTAYVVPENGRYLWGKYGVDAMPEETQKTFDDIKPFIRMLEGSIDKARAKRLRDQEDDSPSENGNPNRTVAPTNSNQHVMPGDQSHGSNANPPTMAAKGATPWAAAESKPQATSLAPSNDQPQRATRLASPKYQWK
jgi:hypothetical protein